MTPNGNSALPLGADEVPRGGATLNPFVIVDDASGFVAFATEVFGVNQNEQARTEMPDGRLIHAEIELGGSLLLLADRLDGWAASPGLLLLWVHDVAEVLKRARSRGAEVVTEPTAFYGETTLARMRDPWNNLWWLYAPAPGQADPEPSWAGGSDTVFRTIDEAMRARDLGS